MCVHCKIWSQLFLKTHGITVKKAESDSSQKHVVCFLGNKPKNCASIIAQYRAFAGFDDCAFQFLEEKQSTNRAEIAVHPAGWCHQQSVFVARLHNSFSISAKQIIALLTKAQEEYWTWKQLANYARENRAVRPRAPQQRGRASRAADLHLDDDVYMMMRTTPPADQLSWCVGRSVFTVLLLLTEPAAV